MTILENSLFHLSTVLFFLSGLGFLIFSYLSKRYEFTARGFILILLGFAQSFFLAVVNQDFFVLSSNLDYGANFVFSLSVLGAAIASGVGLTVYKLHRLVPAMFIQLGILFCSAIIIVTFGSSIFKTIANQKGKEKREETKFYKAEDFQKGSANPKLSKAGTSDSLITR
jgi:hypothetical protein